MGNLLEVDHYLPTDTQLPFLPGVIFYEVLRNQSLSEENFGGENVERNSFQLTRIQPQASGSVPQESTLSSSEDSDTIAVEPLHPAPQFRQTAPSLDFKLTKNDQLYFAGVPDAVRQLQFVTVLLFVTKVKGTGR